MCDTIVALGPATADGAVLFGKNSDREPDEAQNIEVHEASEHPEGGEVECTYISVPQAKRTGRVFLCRPFWMFGAEMGANQHGVVIGNEALFTRVKPDRTGLLGMDILRLGLERSQSARQALEVMISLIERHGQGGKAGYRQNLRYMNGFIIADPEEAYVLETVRSWWAWKKIRDFWSISNLISLTDDFDRCSPGLIENAVKKGWCKSESDFNFRKCYSDLVYTWGAKGEPRERRSRKLLAEARGRLSTIEFMNILRDHGQDPAWKPYKQKGGALCMHASNRLTRPTQSVCSMVAKIGKDRKYYYTTAASNPCMSPFFPVFGPEAGTPGTYVPGGPEYDPEAYWWEAERLHRRALFSFDRAKAAASRLVGEFEDRVVREAESGELDQERVDRYYAEAVELTRRWGRQLSNMSLQRTGFLFSGYWRKYNRKNKIPGEA